MNLEHLKQYLDIIKIGPEMATKSLSNIEYIHPCKNEYIIAEMLKIIDKILSYLYLYKFQTLEELLRLKKNRAALEAYGEMENEE